MYDFNLWARHRSSSRYTRHLFTTFKWVVLCIHWLLTLVVNRSEIIRGILGPVYLMALFATAVCVYEYALEAGTLPANFPDVAVDLDISGPFTLSTFALSLLLAYRTNASYGRFDEARKFWGGVVNRSRDLMRQVWYMSAYVRPSRPAWLLQGAGWMDPKQDAERIDMLGRWMAAFPWTMKCHLRADEDPEYELKVCCSWPHATQGQAATHASWWELCTAALGYLTLVST